MPNPIIKALLAIAGADCLGCANEREARFILVINDLRC